MHYGKGSFGGLTRIDAPSSTIKLERGSKKTKLYCCSKMDRSSPPELFSGNIVLKICSKFTEEHLCRSVVSIKLRNNFIETTLWHGCSVNLPHICRTSFPKNSYGRLLLDGSLSYAHHFEKEILEDDPLGTKDIPNLSYISLTLS